MQLSESLNFEAFLDKNERLAGGIDHRVKSQ